MLEEKTIQTGEGAVTARLAAFAHDLTLDAAPDAAVRVAKHMVLDWLGVTLAGAAEPLVAKLTDYCRAEGLGRGASLVGLGIEGSAGQAALINGAGGHALDYDDVLRQVRGHPTAPVLPVALALAEREGHSGIDMLTAFVAGVELDCRIGELLGDGHYARGWHGTATIGHFGAAAAAARLLGLDRAGMATALGLAGTQAAGLKAVFGTEAKPLHAGKAAANGLLAAELAARGFTCSREILDDPQGYQAVASDDPDPAAALAEMDGHFYIANTLFKYHAACYGTHAGIECGHALRRHPAFTADRIERVEMAVPTPTLAMCNIWEPETGLEMKFSHRLTLAAALAGTDTGDPALYEADATRRADLVALRDKVAVRGVDDIGRRAGEVTLHLVDGTVLRESRDMDRPNPDLDDQETKLEAKFRALAAPVVGAGAADDIVALVADLERLDDMRALAALCRGGARG